MPDTLVIPTLKRKNLRNLVLSDSQASSSSKPSEDLSTTVLPAQEDDETNFPESCNVIIQFRLGIEPGDLGSEGLVVLRTFSKTVTVFQHVVTNSTMVRKVIHVEARSSVRKNIVRELRIMHDCHSEYILEFYSAFESGPGDVVMCMEYMNLGSFDKISQLGPERIDVLGKIVVAVLGGLTYLYSEHRIIHRDLKPSNILANSKGQIKLYNFGVSSELLNSLAETFVGTTYYMAPERIRGQTYSVKSDVWSLGLTLFELAVGRFPYATETKDEVVPLSVLDLLQSIVCEPSPRLPNSAAFPSTLGEMINKCLMKDPNARPTPKELYDLDKFVLAAKRTPVDMEAWAADTMKALKARHILDDSGSETYGQAPDSKDYSVSIQSAKDMNPETMFLNPLRSLMSMRSSLCGRCEKSISDYHTIQSSRQGLEYGANDLGCQLCQLITDCLPPKSSSQLATTNDASPEKLPQVQETSTNLLLKIGHLSSPMYQAMKLSASLEDRSTGSRSAFQMAATWAHTCLTEHNKCPKVSGLAFALLPTRVIDVGVPGGPENPRLHTGGTTAGLYFTLSYRWNQDNSQHFETVKSNLESYSSNIPFCTLPQVMQDAITITRKFGIRYIWIDALCIVQDSIEDWAHEAAAMASIYKNSLLTIAVANDRDGQPSSCFRDRSRRHIRPVNINTQWPSGLDKYIFADRRLTKDGRRPPSALDTRAWTFQEQLLSPRVLSYSNEELYWDCTTLNASETFPNGIPSFYDATCNFLDERLFKEAIFGKSENPVSHERFHTSWRRVVENYSARQMTKETDKLVALLGLVKEAAAFFEDKFLVGLWKKRLWIDLLWWVKEPLKSIRPKSFTAPSWSWISLNAAVSYDLEGFDSIDRLVKCLDIIYADAESDGSLTNLSGTIVAKGRLVVMRPEVHLDAGREPPTPTWKADLGVTASAPIECFIIGTSMHYVYALGLAPFEDSEAHYKRLGLVTWRVNPKVFGWDVEKQKWKDESDLRIITIL